MNDTVVWTQRLRVGDRVILTQAFADRQEICIVSKRTATQIVIGEGPQAIRFRQEDGRQIGASRWHSMTIEPYDDAIAARIVMEQAQNRLGRVLKSIRKEALRHLTKIQCHEVMSLLMRHGIVSPRPNTDQL